jgi:hypothetical protein
MSTGYLFKDLFLGFGSSYFNNSILLLPITWSPINMEFIPAQIKLVPFITSIFATLVTLWLNFQNNVIFIQQSKTYFEACKWFYNECLNSYIAIPSLFYGQHLFNQVEKRNLELNGPILLTESISTAYNRTVRISPAL